MLQLAEATSRAFSLLDTEALERLAAEAESSREACAVQDVNALRCLREVLELQLEAARRSIGLRRRLQPSDSGNSGYTGGPAFFWGKDPWVR